MKHTFVKGMGLALVTALTLTGCNLIEIDEVMQAKEDIAKLQKSYETAAATYNGGEVTVEEAAADFNANYNNMYYMYYYYFGATLSQSDVQDIAEDVLKEKVEEEITAGKFDAAGMTLTAEQEAELQTSIEESYAQIHEEALAEVTGRNDEGKEANAQVLLYRVGNTEEQIKAHLTLEKKSELMKQALLDEVTEVTEDELQAAYEEQLESDKATYTANRAAYGTAMTSASDDTVIAYIPEGYRTVRHILVKPEDEVLNAYTTAKSALTSAENSLADAEAELAELQAAEDTEGMRTEEEINADIETAKSAVAAAKTDVQNAKNACLENVKAKTDEIYAKLAEEGASFADIMAQYGEDPGMQDEANANTGYYVCADSTNWQQEFTDGAMKLANVGDYSTEPVVSGSGVHIIEYFKDIQGGEVALDTIREALTAKTLQAKKEQHRDDTVAGWVEEAKPVYNASVLLNTIAG